MQTYTKIAIPCTTFFNFFCFVAKIFGSLFAATCLGNTLFIGTKKDKRYACLLYCISTTLSFKFLFMFSSPFSRLSQILLYVRTMNIYVYFYLFHFIVCLFSSEGVGAVAAPFFRKCGENVAYRMLSFTLTHIPIAAIAANRLIIIVMFIFLKPFLSFFSILKSSTQSSFYTIFQLKTSIHHLVFIFTFIHH